MQRPSLAPSPAHQEDQRLLIARLALLFVCGASPRSVPFAQNKLRDLFGYTADESDIRAAQQQILAEAVNGLADLLRGAK